MQSSPLPSQDCVGLPQFFRNLPVPLAPNDIFRKQLRKWQFSSLSAITCEAVKWHFLPIPPEDKQCISQEFYVSSWLRFVRCAHRSLSFPRSSEILSPSLLFTSMLKFVSCHSAPVSLAAPSASQGFSNIICLVQVFLGPKSIMDLENHHPHLRAGIAK